METSLRVVQAMEDDAENYQHSEDTVIRLLAHILRLLLEFRQEAQERF